MKTIETFWDNTAAVWTLIEDRGEIGCLSKEPFAVNSKSGSAYYTDTINGQKVIVRESSKWGEVGNCYWPLEDKSGNRTSTMTKEPVLAYCPLSEFLDRQTKLVLICRTSSETDMPEKPIRLELRAYVSDRYTTIPLNRVEEKLKKDEYWEKIVGGLMASLLTSMVSNPLCELYTREAVFSNGQVMSKVIVDLVL